MPSARSTGPITDAGLILQIDEPNFLTAWMFYPDYTVEEYRKLLEGYVEVINYALEGIPMEQVRFHSCWGSGHRPHVHDIELKYVADILVKINAKAFSIEAANVRHEHEWQVWKDVKFPEGRIYHARASSATPPTWSSTRRWSRTAS